MATVPFLAKNGHFLTCNPSNRVFTSLHKVNSTEWAKTTFFRVQGLVAKNDLLSPPIYGPIDLFRGTPYPPKMTHMGGNLAGPPSPCHGPEDTGQGPGPAGYRHRLITVLLYIIYMHI